MIQRQHMHPLGTIALFAVLFVALLAAPGAAQSSTVPPVGVRVRIQLPDSLRAVSFGPQVRTLVGVLTRATPDTVWLDIGSPDTVRIPRAAIRSMRTSLGQSRAASAAELGLFAGITYGLVAYASSHVNERGTRALQFGIGGVAVGALLGALRPYERWAAFRP